MAAKRSHRRSIQSILIAAVMLAGLTSGSRAAESPPADWLTAIRQQIEREEYGVTWQAQTQLPGQNAAWQAPNRAQGFRTYFTEQGIRVIPRTGTEPAWEWGLSLIGFGRADNLRSAVAASLSVSENRIEYRRSEITEWYLNSPKGLEQGFTLAVPPEELPEMNEDSSLAGPTARPHSTGDESAATPVFVVLALSGTLSPVLTEDRQAIDFMATSGARVIHYAGLRVRDARGLELPAWMEGFAESGMYGIRLVVDDREAEYPLVIDPLATSPAWSAESDQASAEFGTAVATAGDVNGDGYDDVLVGAPRYDNGHTDEGRAYLYLGSASGLAAFPAWTAEGDQYLALYGESLGTAGDVNGDGYSDVIVGARGYDNDQTSEGRAYVYHGSPSGLGASPAWTGEGNQENASFGNAVSTAGDFNGDGYSDVVVGAHTYSNPQSYEGRTFVYLGSSAGLSPTPAWTAESQQASAYFGDAVGAAGDVNGDGYSDVIIGAYLYGNGQTQEGRVWVYTGSVSGQPGAVWTAEGNIAYAYFGDAVGTAGDVNGDGYSDVIIGAPNYNGNDGGKAFVYLGSASGLQYNYAWTASGPAQSSFGLSVGPAGDINGDGYSDITIGAPFEENGQADEGAAYVWFGSAQGIQGASWRVEGEVQFSRLGRAVGTAGDVNGDGFADLIVGASAYDHPEFDEGRAFLYLGSPAGLGYTNWAPTGETYAEHFGEAVASAGDVNGDGYSDVIVGAPGFSGGESHEGRAYLYLGSATGLTFPAAWTAEGNYGEANFGQSVATAGDINGDGYADVIVGAPRHAYGMAYVYHGSAAGLSATANWTAHNPTWCGENACRYGASVSTAGDMNGDGYADVAIGAPAYAMGGSVYIYFGSAAGLSSDVGRHLDRNDRHGDRFGSSVACAGDVNGDGYSDVIAGAPWADDPFFHGEALIFYGHPSGSEEPNPWSFRGENRDTLGYSVASAGDVNGDGYSDVVIGAREHGLHSGRALVFHGSPSGPGSTPNWVVDGPETDALLGECVASAGDVNGDGYSDVLITRNYLSGSGGSIIGTFSDVYHGSASGLGACVWTTHIYGGSRGSVASAGDVNGDGYSDALLGDGANSEWCDGCGRVYLYQGNNGSGLSLIPQQRRPDDAAPIGPLGSTDSVQGFRLAATGRNPFGRGKIRLEWEVKPLGVSFNGAETGIGTAWWDSGVGGVALNDLVGNLEVDTIYHWRIRLRYHPASSPFAARSRWLTGPWNGLQEADLRTCADADGDGLTRCAADCNDANPHCTTSCTDADADGWCVGYDCDDSRPGCNFDCTDVDNDGYCGTTDCNDADISIHSGAIETCDGRDDDCDGALDEGCDTACDAPEKQGSDIEESNVVAPTHAPDLVWTGSVFGVAWSAGPDIHFARLTPTGSKIGSDTVLAIRAPELSLVWTGSEFGLSWSDTVDATDEIYFLRFDDSGNPIGSSLRLTNAPASSTTPSLVWTGSEYGIAWVDSRNGNSEIYFGRIDRTGTKIGADLRVTDDPASSRNPTLVWTGSEFGITWQDGRNGEFEEIYFTRVDATGQKIGSDVRLTSCVYNCTLATLAWNGREYGTTWNYQNLNGRFQSKYFARLDETGLKIGSDILLTQSDGSAEHWASLVWNGTEYALAWPDQRTQDAWGSEEIYFARIGVNGEKIGTDVAMSGYDTRSLYPSLAWTGSDYGLAWREGPNLSGFAEQIYFARIGCCDNVDGDGFNECHECDDTHAAVYPGALQVCDDLNNDCNAAGWPSTAGTNEADDDGDGLSECAGDGNDADPTAWAVPGQPGGAGFTGDNTVLSWNPPSEPGGSVVYYDTLRSPSAADFSTGSTCVETDDASDTMAIDAATPAAGNAFFYLIRAGNSCGEGSLGTESSGEERVGRACP